MQKTVRFLKKLPNFMKIEWVTKKSYKTKYTKGQLVRVKQKTLWITKRMKTSSKQKQKLYINFLKAKLKVTEQMYKNFKPKKEKQKNRHITYLYLETIKMALSVHGK